MAKILVHVTTDPDSAGKPAELAMPSALVRLALDHDRVLTY